MAIENVAKGPGDKPKEPVTIVESGEIPIEVVVGEDGSEIPLRVEL